MIMKEKEVICEILRIEMLGMESGESMVRDLRVGSGYGYHGGEWRDVGSWRYCLRVPSYSVLGYLSLDWGVVLGAAVGNFRKYRSVERLEVGDRVLIELDGNETLEFSGEKLLMSYECYAASLLEEKAYLMPSLVDLVNVYDMDESYLGESTIILNDYAEYLSTGKFRKHFRPMNLPGILGKIHLVEGEFWVRSLKPRPSLLLREKKGINLGGKIRRLS